ncbi:MAG: alkaline phosphatase [Gammaproteobacteria bacterium]|nr:alkaline phosphatase [Gammaproteobacteria bacterium]
MQQRNPLHTLIPACAALLGGLILAGCTAAPAATTAPAAGADPSPEARDETSAAWWEQRGRAAIARARQPIADGDARNLILFVGDGMGVSTVTAARILAGQQAGGSGEEHQLAFERFPRAGLAKTYNTNQQTSDSAGTMTAMITGAKTLAGVLSVDGSVTRGDCASSLDAAVPTLVERAEDAGLATGIVSTTRITHATPGATYAHTPERNWEVDTAMPAEAKAAGCRDIAAQLLDFDHGDGIDVILGGGRSMFLPSSEADPEQASLHGRRGDGRNLIDEWRTANPGGHWVWNAEQFASIPEDDGPVLGLFEPSHMQFEADRPRDAAGEPSLAQMTELAIRRLEARGSGYVLVVEGGRIDHAHHAANAWRALTDTIALSDAVERATELTSEDDTLILVTADHSHTMTISGYPTRGNPILGLVVGNDDSGRPSDDPMEDALGLPVTTLSYANGPGWHGATDTQDAGPKRAPHRFSTAEPHPDGRADLSEVDTTDPMFLQESTAPSPSETHAGEDVPVYVRGPGADLLGGVIEQNVIYYLLEAALGDAL